MDNDENPASDMNSSDSESDLITLAQLKRSCTSNPEANDRQVSEDNYLSTYDDSGQDSDYLPQKDKYEYSDSGHESLNEKKAGFSRKADEKSSKRKDRAGQIKQKKWKLRRFVMIRSKKARKQKLQKICLLETRVNHS